ncbi:hypothetical protein ACU6VI_03385 [Sphaerotilus natans]|uniref:hypothetical protein n=1 Tax=Sphaerotilus natans TaxID=34103 RepID=UPI00406BF282
MTSTTTFHLVRQATAAKLGANSTGTISYAVLIDADRTEPFIALTGNDGGGYFSREAVPISALRRCAEQACTGSPLGARAFKPAFMGRSTNNGYFAVAALCAEGLLNRVQRDGPGRGQPLADAGFWDDWCAQVRAQADEQGDALPVFQIGKPAVTEPAAEPAEADADKATTGGDTPEAVSIESPPFAETVADNDAGQSAQADDDAAPAGDTDAAEPAGKPRRRAKAKA